MSYFSDRTQRVQLDGILSEFASIVCGVPQGSVFKCDDPSQALGEIKACISDIRRWMILNKLKINDAKTEFIVFRSPMLKHDLSDLSVNVGGNVIKPSEKVRDLGVILDQTLSFDDHISTISQSAHFHIRNIGRIRNLLSFDDCATIIHALIGSRLDYCNSLLYNIADAKVERLQKVQNQAARIRGAKLGKIQGGCRFDKGGRGGGVTKFLRDKNINFFEFLR